MAQTIALVDDDRNILTSLQMTLEAEGFSVRTYTDGESALHGITTKPVDLAVLDIKMPRMDGLELLQRLRKQSALPVIFLTSKDEELDELMGLRLGADDYITKPFPMETLLARIRALLRRSGATPAKGTLKFHDITMDLAAHRVQRQGRSVHLGPTEFRLLEFFMQHAGRVFSREELLDAVWGPDIHVEPRTVDVHIRRLRKALGEPHHQLIQTVRGTGYRFSAKG